MSITEVSLPEAKVERTGSPLIWSAILYLARANATQVDLGCGPSYFLRFCFLTQTDSPPHQPPQMAVKSK